MRGLWGWLGTWNQPWLIFGVPLFYCALVAGEDNSRVPLAFIFIQQVDSMSGCAPGDGADAVGVIGCAGVEAGAENRSAFGVDGGPGG
ncbi:hypothetical protein C5D55_00525 [Rathayibacter toxicus]|nr:hypothetical protein C5D55_00525 [Rathayibacter toxicus]